MVVEVDWPRQTKKGQPVGGSGVACCDTFNGVFIEGAIRSLTRRFSIIFASIGVKGVIIT